MRNTQKLALLAVAAVACATPQKKEVKHDVPNAGVMKQDIKVVKEDAASKAFQEEANYLREDAKKGHLDYSDVNARMDDVLHRYPNYALALFNKGVALEHLGQDKEAEDAYRRAIALNPALREAQENLAALAAKRDPGEAVSLLRELIARDPGAAQARIALASYVMAQGDYDEATNLCQEALTYQPKNIGGYCVLAQAAVKQKDLLRARLLAAQGLKIDKNGACLHFVLGQVALAEKQTGQALAAFETAVQNNPRLIEARFRIAQISMGFKDFKKAIDNYVAITKAEPKNAAAYVNLGIALKGSGRFDDAEKAYQQAIQVADGPSAGPAHYNLGVLYLRDLKRLDDAQENLKRVLQVGDGDDDTVFKMLEEIQQMKAFQEEEKRAEEEAKKQEEIDKKAAEEEAKQKKLDEEIDKKLKAEEAKKAKDEPQAPAEGDTPPIEPEPQKRPKSKAKPSGRKKPKKREKEPSDPIPKPDDFE